MSGEAWDREGVLENLIAPGINLYHYTDFAPGVSHYVLVMFSDDGSEAYKQERTFHWGDDLEARQVMDGIRDQWTGAQLARAAGDEYGALALTYRGLRLIFPNLPEDPSNIKEIA